MPARLANTVGRRAGEGADRLRAVQVRQGRVAAGQPGGLRAQRGLRAARASRPAARPAASTSISTAWCGATCRTPPRRRARSRPASSTTGSSRPPTSPRGSPRTRPSPPSSPIPVGLTGWLRPNHLHPPFNNKKARQALLYMVDQEMYLQAAIGQAQYYRTCPGIFFCGKVPYETKAGAPMRQDLDRARQLMKESGYDGRPVVVLDPTDRPEIHGTALVTQELLTKIGVTVDLQAVDWSTLLSRRAKKDPPSAGGWNIFLTNWISLRRARPRGQRRRGRRRRDGWFGWSVEPADGKAPPRLDPRDRPRQAQAAGRADPDRGLRRGALRPLGPVRPALALSARTCAASCSSPPPCCGTCGSTPSRLTVL